MIGVYLCRDNVHERLNGILGDKLSQPFEILKTENGKPYVEGNPLHFSLSHSGGRGIIALSDTPIGVDFEIFKDKPRTSVINRFSAREQAEIANERDFLKHWTAREAYVKLYGLKIAETWKRIEFFSGKLYLDGQLESVKLRYYCFAFGIAAVCCEELL